MAGTAMMLVRNIATAATTLSVTVLAAAIAAFGVIGK